MILQWLLYLFLVIYMPLNWLNTASSSPASSASSLASSLQFITSPSRIAALSALLPLAFPLYLASRMNAKLRYYYRFALYCTTLGLTSAWAVLVSVALSLVGQNHSIQHWVARSFYWFASPIVGWKIKVEGREYLENEAPTVFVGNHQS